MLSYDGDVLTDFPWGKHLRPGVGKLQLAMNFCAAHRQIIKKKFINVEERNWMLFSH